MYIQGKFNIPSDTSDEKCLTDIYFSERCHFCMVVNISTQHPFYCFYYKICNTYQNSKLFNWVIVVVNAVLFYRTTMILSMLVMVSFNICCNCSLTNKKNTFLINKKNTPLSQSVSDVKNLFVRSNTPSHIILHVHLQGKANVYNSAPAPGHWRQPPNVAWPRVCVVRRLVQRHSL